MSAADLRRQLEQAEAREAQQAEQQALLETVAAAAERAQVARLDLERSMRVARDAGLALRPIADAAGFTHEWTRRLLAKGGA